MGDEEEQFLRRVHSADSKRNVNNAALVSGAASGAIVRLGGSRREVPYRSCCAPAPAASPPSAFQLALLLSCCSLQGKQQMQPDTMTDDLTRGPGLDSDPTPEKKMTVHDDEFDDIDQVWTAPHWISLTDSLLLCNVVFDAGLPRD